MAKKQAPVATGPSDLPDVPMPNFSRSDERCIRLLAGYMAQVADREGVFFTSGADWSDDDWPLVRQALVLAGHQRITDEDAAHQSLPSRE